MKGQMISVDRAGSFLKVDWLYAEKFIKLVFRHVRGDEEGEGGLMPFLRLYCGGPLSVYEEIESLNPWPSGLGLEVRLWMVPPLVGKEGEGSIAGLP